MYKDSLGKVYVEIIDAILQKEGFTRWSTERSENCVEYHYWDNFYGIILILRSLDLSGQYLVQFFLLNALSALLLQMQSILQKCFLDLESA